MASAESGRGWGGGLGALGRRVSGSGQGPWLGDPQGAEERPETGARWLEAGKGPGSSCPPVQIDQRGSPAPLQTGEDHTVTHLQYVAWPDHGVPDDSADFLEFVNSVRSLRVDGEPVLVHCRYCGLLTWFYQCWYSLGEAWRQVAGIQPTYIPQDSICAYKALVAFCLHSVQRLSIVKQIISPG